MILVKYQDMYIWYREKKIGQNTMIKWDGAKYINTGR